MLLAADANRLYFGSHGFGLAQRPSHGAGGGIPPGMRMLLFGSRRQTGNQIIFLGSRRDHLPVSRVHDDSFRRLRAAVDA